MNFTLGIQGVKIQIAHPSKPVKSLADQNEGNIPIDRLNRGRERGVILNSTLYEDLRCVTANAFATLRRTGRRSTGLDVQHFTYRNAWALSATEHSLLNPRNQKVGLGDVQTKQSRKLPFSSLESDVRKRILGQGSRLSVVFVIEIEHHEQFVKPVTGGANACRTISQSRIYSKL
ncbi:hypothetical protein QYF36_007178 [Acer negundo]|nr:hypothetical protein QYF36_007178 [Acer negundo]